MIKSADILNARILIVDDKAANVRLLDAIASSIFLTTATDVASMGLLLGLAAVLVK